MISSPSEFWLLEIATTLFWAVLIKFRLRDSNAGIMNIFDLEKCPSDLISFCSPISARDGAYVRVYVWYRRW